MNIIIVISSHSGTPTWGDDPVSQPVFQHPGGFGEGHRHSPVPILYPPPLGEDPFQMNIAAEDGDLSEYIS